MPLIKKKSPKVIKDISNNKTIRRKIEEIEKLNYFLYLIIVVVIGLVFFSVSYFTTNKIVEVANYNEVDRSVELLNVTDAGFDVSIKSRDEVKIRYYIGTSQDVMPLFNEKNEYVREDYFQFRSLMNGKKHYLQVEFEKIDGTKIRSRVIEAK